MLNKKNSGLKCKLKLVSYTSKDLNLYFFYLIKQLHEKKIKFNFIRMPIKKKRLTLYKSPHVHKKAKSQYESKVHGISIFINFNTFNDFQCSLSNIFVNKPKSVLMNITSNG